MNKLSEEQVKDLAKRLDAYAYASEALGSYTEARCAFDASDALLLLLEEVKQYRGEQN